MAPPMNGPRFNEFIVSPKVRVIDENGENLGVMLTAVLFIKLGFRRRFDAANLGSMSPQWIAALRASQQSSSI